MSQNNHVGEINRESPSYKLKERLLRKAFDKALYGKGECKYTPPEMISRILGITQERRKGMPKGHKKLLDIINQAEKISEGEPKAIRDLNLDSIKNTTQNKAKIKEEIFPTLFEQKFLRQPFGDEEIDDVLTELSEMIKQSSYNKARQKKIIENIDKVLRGGKYDSMRLLNAFKPVLHMKPRTWKTSDPDQSNDGSSPDGPTLH